MNFIWEKILKLIGRDEATLLKKYGSQKYQEMLREKTRKEEQKSYKNVLKKVRKFMRWCVKEKSKGLFRGEIITYFEIEFSKIDSNMFYLGKYYKKDDLRNPLIAFDILDTIQIFGTRFHETVIRAFEELVESEMNNTFELKIQDKIWEDNKTMICNAIIILRFKETTPAQ